MVNLYGNLKIFSGTSHPDLAAAIAKELKIELSPMDIKRFANGEIYAKPAETVRGCDVYLVQTATDHVNDDMMELFIMLDAFRRSFARSIHVVMPHFGYSRQDRVASPREPISARLMADLLSTAGATHLMSLSFHSGQTQGFFSFPVDNVPTYRLFCDYFKDMDMSNTVIVSPDEGGGKTIKKMADPMGADMAIINKERPSHNEAIALGVVGNVKGKDCIIFDDMIDTAGSVIAARDALIKAGANPDIYLAATHAVFSGPAVERLKSAQFKEVIVTDSIPLSEEKRFPGLKVISVASILGRVIRNIHEDRSVTEIWQECA